MTRAVLWTLLAFYCTVTFVMWDPTVAFRIWEWTPDGRLYFAVMFPIGVIVVYFCGEKR